MLSLKNKKQNGVVFALALFLFLSGVFFFSPASAHAAGFWGWPGEAISDVFKGLLYGIFLAIGLFTSAAITMFEWAIKPENISGPSGILNSSSVYGMWKFVRDFFNLFFILTLLYTAFTIVFQVAKDYKKTLLSLVLAALFVNFSFPITRVIIDVTNVPMYYFINQIGAGKDAKEGKLGSMLSASQLKGILIPGAQNGGTATMSDITVGRLLLAIIFIFMFTVSLMVLAVMFVIRLVALIMLLIFSSVGFAASVIPGMGSYGNKWWENLSKYALFGPAAALMLFVSTQFFKEISKNDTSNQFLQSGTSMVVSQDLTLVSSMAMFAIPIIMLWMAIGMASSMSIIGAGAVVGMGQSVIKGAGKRLYNNPIGRGFYSGAKKTLKDGNFYGLDYGKKLPGGKFLTGKYWAQPSTMEAAIAGRMGGGAKGAISELAKLKQKQVNERIKENKENQVTRSALLQDLASKDETTKHAAALSLAEMGEIRSADDLTRSLNALAATVDEKGNATSFSDDSADMILKVIDKAKDGASAGITPELYNQIAESSGGWVVDTDKDGNETYKRNASGERIAGGTLEALDSKLKKDGNIHIKVNYKIDEEIERSKAAGAELSREMAQERVYDKMVLPLAAEDLIKQTKLHEQSGFKEYFGKKLEEQPKRLDTILDKAMEKGKPQVQAVWSDIKAKKGDDPEDAKKKAERERLHEKMQQRKQANGR